MAAFSVVTDINARQFMGLPSGTKFVILNWPSEMEKRARMFRGSDGSLP